MKKIQEEHRIIGSPKLLLTQTLPNNAIKIAGRENYEVALSFGAPYTDSELENILYQYINKNFIHLNTHLNYHLFIWFCHSQEN